MSKETKGQGKVRAGRKRADQSRAAEIRPKLEAWQNTLGPHRVSLRALARELRTSHQLLASYLKGLKKWQAKDYRLRAKAIREGARAEHRQTTAAEEHQAITLEGLGSRLVIESALDSAYKRYEKEFRDMPPSTLTGTRLRLVETLARQGVPFARKLLQERQINLPTIDLPVAKSFGSVPR